MMSRLKHALRRLTGASPSPPDPARADTEIRSFIASLQHLAAFARVGGRIARASMKEARR